MFVLQTLKGSKIHTNRAVLDSVWVLPPAHSESDQVKAFSPTGLSSPVDPYWFYGVLRSKGRHHLSVHPFFLGHLNLFMVTAAEKDTSDGMSVRQIAPWSGSALLGSFEMNSGNKTELSLNSFFKIKFILSLSNRHWHKLIFKQFKVNGHLNWLSVFSVCGPSCHELRA